MSELAETVVEADIRELLVAINNAEAAFRALVDAVRRYGAAFSSQDEDVWRLAWYGDGFLRRMEDVLKGSADELGVRLRLPYLRAMPYAEYLKTTEWDQTRRAALQRANYRCQLCGSDNVRLSVHHNTYERRGQERPSDVIALCDGCHANHHHKQMAP